MKGERAAERVAGRFRVLEPVDAFGGEAVEVRRSGGFERRLAVEFGRRPVGEAVEDDEEDLHGRAAALSRRRSMTRTTAGGTSDCQSSPFAMRRRTSLASISFSMPGWRTSTR